jgi:hypothetical protein
MPPSNAPYWQQSLSTSPNLLSPLYQIPQHVLPHCLLYLSGNLSQTNIHFPFILVTSLNIPPSRRSYMASVTLISLWHHRFFPPSGLSFWWNGTLYACVNTTTPGPCLLMVIIPQLTLYIEAELAWLLSPWQRRAAFLPFMVRISLASSIAPLGLAGGALGRSLISARDFENRLQVTLESTSVSLVSLQWQLTSLAQVALQNCRALDLLTTEKGGTCLFFLEECCYYINESGLVEQNIDALSPLSEEI